MILFETTESVIEVLWDVALAFFVVRLALIYFALNFFSAIALSYLALNGLTPVTHLVTLQSHEVLIPFLLASAVVWARLLIVRYEIPRNGWFRFAIGMVALVLMGLAEVIVGWVVYEEGWWEEEVLGALVGGEGNVYAVVTAVMAWFALMPWGMMWFETAEAVPVEVVEVVEEKRPVEQK